MITSLLILFTYFITVLVVLFVNASSYTFLSAQLLISSNLLFPVSLPVWLNYFILPIACFFLLPHSLLHVYAEIEGLMQPFAVILSFCELIALVQQKSLKLSKKINSAYAEHEEIQRIQHKMILWTAICAFLALYYLYQIFLLTFHSKSLIYILIALIILIIIVILLSVSIPCGIITDSTFVSFLLALLLYEFYAKIYVASYPSYYSSSDSSSYSNQSVFHYLLNTFLPISLNCVAILGMLLEFHAFHTQHAENKLQLSTLGEMFTGNYVVQCFYRLLVWLLFSNLLRTYCLPLFQLSSVFSELFSQFYLYKQYKSAENWFIREYHSHYLHRPREVMRWSQVEMLINLGCILSVAGYYLFRLVKRQININNEAEEGEESIQKQD
jgi:hypothetical protein